MKNKAVYHLKNKKTGKTFCGLDINAIECKDFEHFNCMKCRNNYVSYLLEKVERYNKGIEQLSKLDLMVIISKLGDLKAI